MHYRLEKKMLLVAQLVEDGDLGDFDDETVLEELEGLFGKNQCVTPQDLRDGEDMDNS